MDRVVANIFSQVLQERLSVGLSQAGYNVDWSVAWPIATAILLFLGVGSVVYWHLTDDLRPYFFVQVITHFISCEFLLKFSGRAIHFPNS